MRTALLTAIAVSLWFCIAAVSEMAVQKAKNEITRLIKEELVRLVSCELIVATAPCTMR